MTYYKISMIKEEKGNETFMITWENDYLVAKHKDFDSKSKTSNFIKSLKDLGFKKIKVFRRCEYKR